ncbi:probable polygalacturonase, partial [Tanacetum coccineum]
SSGELYRHIGNGRQFIIWLNLLEIFKRSCLRIHGARIDNDSMSILDALEMADQFLVNNMMYKRIVVCRRFRFALVDLNKYVTVLKISEAEVPVNWCPALGTVLANEEVVDGVNSSDSVCIENSNISMGYDAISLKSGWDEYGIKYGIPTTSPPTEDDTMERFDWEKIMEGDNIIGLKQ